MHLVGFIIRTYLYRENCQYFSLAICAFRLCSCMSRHTCHYYSSQAPKYDIEFHQTIFHIYDVSVIVQRRWQKHMTLIHGVVNDSQRKSHENVQCIANGRNVDINTRVPHLPFDMYSFKQLYIFSLIFNLMDYNYRCGSVVRRGSMDVDEERRASSDNF